VIEADTLPLTISRRAWAQLVRELAARGRGERESGAFLLARTRRRSRHVAATVFFDDLDGQALNGTISIRGAAFGRLWELCAARGMRVVGDVHTHPSGWVAQSDVDAANPMVAKRGHVAVILPHFARRGPLPADAGVHVYQGDRRWTSAFGSEAAALVRRTWW
jgi:proteasome lid subunit RPN8/RPN11